VVGAAVVVTGAVVVVVALPQPTTRKTMTNRIARGTRNFFTSTSLFIVCKNGLSQNHSHILQIEYGVI
jgi:hypothetical protein